MKPAFSAGMISFSSRSAKSVAYSSMKVSLFSVLLDLAKSSNTLNKLTFMLLYATDFADRLEKEIIPALKAGFIVLSDRYIFTALARAGVRGVDRTWIRNLYSSEERR